MSPVTSDAAAWTPRSVQVGEWKITALSDGFFRLDGGSMWGVVPANLWRKLTPPAEDNTIRLLWEQTPRVTFDDVAGCEASKQAYDYARQNRKRFSFGLHFNIVDGFEPLAGKDTSLCDEPGAFRESDAQRYAAMAGLLANTEIRREFSPAARRVAGQPRGSYTCGQPRPPAHVSVDHLFVTPGNAPRRHHDAHRRSCAASPR